MNCLNIKSSQKLVLNFPTYGKLKSIQYHDIRKVLFTANIHRNLSFCISTTTFLSLMSLHSEGVINATEHLSPRDSEALPTQASTLTKK